MSIVGKLIERYPKLPTLLANTAVSKVIQLIKNKALDPFFEHEQTVQRIQSWPQSIQKVAEWVPYFLSGVVRTMPAQEHPVGIVLQEALAETLTQIGIKVDEISMADRMEIIDMTMPSIRTKLIGTARTDYRFRDRVDTISGTAHDWNKVIQEADNFVSRISEKTQAHREARKAHGWGRFIWKK